ncbi:phenylalanyl-tRNA synthetase alpha subunit [Microbacterium testaceum StLB037]|uniref:Phenylalanyl-tRNA synthetase alpha subunit n=1 Tax=Microbacterium testaceum (strain StLB037) TaxID=979556 RepID=E8NBH3_MICTS|nr:hypothetical protein [Microbacterium testaceum]BAJ76030.1 phenylalanyl-tRNA synthetase alpha subunit [Microbacterium testaceum StLB037]
MTRRVVAGFGALLLLGLPLTACSASGVTVDEALSVDDAKALAQKVEREIAAVLPSSMLADLEQQEKGAFFGCTRDGARQWAGGLTATVVGDPTPEDVIGVIADHYRNGGDYRVSLRQDQGDSIVNIAGEYGSLWIVRYIRDRAELDVDSFSPCIRLPDGVWPGGSY